MLKWCCHQICWKYTAILCNAKNNALSIGNVLNNSSFNQHKITKSNWPFIADTQQKTDIPNDTINSAQLPFDYLYFLLLNAKMSFYVFEVVKLRQISAYSRCIAVYKQPNSTVPERFENKSVFFSVFLHFRRWQQRYIRWEQCGFIIWAWQHSYGELQPCECFQCDHFDPSCATAWLAKKQYNRLPKQNGASGSGCFSLSHKKMGFFFFTFISAICFNNKHENSLMNFILRLGPSAAILK